MDKRIGGRRGAIFDKEDLVLYMRHTLLPLFSSSQYGVSDAYQWNCNEEQAAAVYNY